MCWCGHDLQSPTPLAVEQCMVAGSLYGNILVVSGIEDIIYNWPYIFSGLPHNLVNGLQCSKMEREGETVMKTSFAYIY